MKKLAIVLLCFCLNGCLGTSYYRVYDKSFIITENDTLPDIKYINTRLRLPTKQDRLTKESGDTSKESCIYYLSYFLPLNFWNFHTEEEMVKNIIHDASNRADKKHAMTNIRIIKNTFASPIFSLDCKIVYGKIIEN